MDLQIIHTKDDSFVGYARRYIFGLNLLPDGHTQLGTRSDPRLTFLRESASQYEAAGVIDKEADRANRLEMYLPDNSYELVANSLIRGEVIGPAHSSDHNGLFFPKVAPDLFDFEEAESSGKYQAVAFHILYSDALTLFVSPGTRDASFQLSELLGSPAASSEGFLRRSVELYEIVMTSYADGDFFCCYAKDPSKFEMLNGPLDVTVTEIKEMPWFQESKNAFVWDGQYSMCLVEKNKATI